MIVVDTFSGGIPRTLLTTVPPDPEAIAALGSAERRSSALGSSISARRASIQLRSLAATSLMNRNRQ
jgi:hypothetical protein